MSITKEEKPVCKSWTVEFPQYSALQKAKLWRHFRTRNKQKQQEPFARSQGEVVMTGKQGRHWGQETEQCCVIQFSGTHGVLASFFLRIHTYEDRRIVWGFQSTLNQTHSFQPKLDFLPGCQKRQRTDEETCHMPGQYTVT